MNKQPEFSMIDTSALLAKDAVTAARSLIGWELYVHEDDGSLTGGTIIETEAYMADDTASHSFRGKTPRNEVMFGPAGHLYVYFTYGMHWCMNVVTGAEGDGQAVLIRAIKHTKNLTLIRSRRNNKPDHLLTNGPAKVCQALGVSGNDNGARIDGSRFTLCPHRGEETLQIECSERIGISHDTHRLWRFYLKD